MPSSYWVGSKYGKVKSQIALLVSSCSCIHGNVKFIHFNAPLTRDLAVFLENRN